jgi:hypothetical protein
MAARDPGATARGSVPENGRETALNEIEPPAPVSEQIELKRLQDLRVALKMTLSGASAEERFLLSAYYLVKMRKTQGSCFRCRRPQKPTFGRSHGAAKCSTVFSEAELEEYSQSFSIEFAQQRRRLVRGFGLLWAFRAGGWRQVIDLSGHCSGELLQVV